MNAKIAEDLRALIRQAFEASTREACQKVLDDMAAMVADYANDPRGAPQCLDPIRLNQLPGGFVDTRPPRPAKLDCAGDALRYVIGNNHG